MDKISLIVAVSRNSCIGLKNTLPWRQREDMKFFKQSTVDKAVIMGRKTYDSLGGKSLPKRLNIVISDRLKDEEIDNIVVAGSVSEAIKIAQDYGLEPVIIGGASIYEQSIDIVDEILITVLDTELEGDAFFPELPIQDWEREIIMFGPADENNDFKYTTYRLFKKDR
jgi:dihydrofolate reductase